METKQSRIKRLKAELARIIQHGYPGIEDAMELVVKALKDEIIILERG